MGWSVTKVAGGNIVDHPTAFSLDSKFVVFFHLKTNTSRLLFTCSSVISVYSCTTGDLVKTLQGHQDTVTSVVPNPENQFQLYSASLDGTIILWDYQEGTILKVCYSAC